MKGWDYKISTWTRKLKRGQSLEVERMDETGWMWAFYFVTDDCYGGFRIKFQGADLSMTTLGDYYPKLNYDAGAITQDPAGWQQLYYRPNPQSSAGAYFGIAGSFGFQGTSMPYVPTTITQLFLLPDSTQEEATVSVTAIRIIITNKKEFIKSLRAVMGMPTIQDIDSALLVAGMQEVTQKGEFDQNAKEKK